MNIRHIREDALEILAGLLLCAVLFFLVLGGLVQFYKVVDSAHCVVKIGENVAFSGPSHQLGCGYGTGWVPTCIVSTGFFLTHTDRRITSDKLKVYCYDGETKRLLWKHF